MACNTASGSERPVGITALHAVAGTLGETSPRASKAGSGAECLAEMARELPDIVLMDIQLPSEDGLAVTRKIRSDPRLKGVIVVALTAHAMAGDRERILAAGCDGYIPKPVDPQGLPGEVARYLEQGRLKSA